jgi:Ca2+:H+ antiporter
MYHKTQSFNALANQVCNSLLFLAVVGLSLPCAAGVLTTISFTDTGMLYFSRFIAILLLFVYLSYLYFQLITHNDMFTGKIETPGGGQLTGGECIPEEDDGDEEEEPEQPALTITAELGLLLLISVIVALASEYAAVPLAASLMSCS